MKSTYFLTATLFIFAAIQAPAIAEENPTRRVVQGDVLYRASAIARNEVRAVFLAEARATRMLSIECGAPPHDTRVYKQEAQRLSDGSHLVTVEAGTALFDCEEIRKASPAKREQLSHPALKRTVSYYEKLMTSEEQDAAPALPNLKDSIRVSQSRPSTEVVAEPLWTHEQEISHLQSIHQRMQMRVIERQRAQAQ